MEQAAAKEPMAGSAQPLRTVTLFGATLVGIGAIVGGGILVLAGVAFEAAGPGAIVAFAANGLIALLTALSFAEMSSAMPENGGAYVFAKRVLAVRAAFAVGWVLWFAYIVAGVLYALGFAAYAVELVAALIRVGGGEPPPWLSMRPTLITLALGAASLYTIALIRKASGGGQVPTIGKVILFVVLILVGVWALATSEPGTVERGMTPFLPQGVGGLIAAMGFTFIALQGFDLVAAIGGEVKAPERTIPRAMLLSLGAAIVIYIPLLFLVSTVGTPPDGDIGEMSAAEPATVMATAARNFMGPAGFWVVLVAAVLSTLSALAASILAASRVALTMARDRTLPRVIAAHHPTRATPVMAIYTSALALAVILLMVPDVAAAGAAASLIFLVSFALAHYTSILARRRATTPAPFRTPWFPLVPVVGGVACVALALFQAVAVPSAGAIVMVWLGLGVILYFSLFASRARVVDAFAEARDPELSALRGRTPLVLVPVANPASAPALVALGSALAPPAVGRVVLLTVMKPPGPEESWDGTAPRPLVRAQATQREALAASFGSGHAPEALMTISGAPWGEISRVARVRACESLLLGLSSVDDPEGVARLEALLNEVDCDVAVLRAPEGWTLHGTRRIVVPVGGRGGHDALRARLLGSLGRRTQREVRFLRILPTASTPAERAQALRSLRWFAEEETPGAPSAEVLPSDDVVAALAAHALPDDLLVLGLQRHRGRRLFGQLALRIARQVPCATIMISRKS